MNFAGNFKVPRHWCRDPFEVPFYGGVTTRSLVGVRLEEEAPHALGSRAGRGYQGPLGGMKTHLGVTAVEKAENK